ncbi:MAG: alpha/beta hydrolase, partial [Bacteroidota bacterium]
MQTSPKSIFRFVRSVLIAGIVALIFWSLIIMIFEEKFVFFPSGYSEDFYRSAAIGLNPTDHWFQAEDGTKLHAWFVQAKDPIGILLNFHGNGGNLAHRAEKIRRLRNAGLSTFIVDYRGYGRSEGGATESGVYQDARAAYDYLLSLPGIDSSSIIVHGTSLGGAVAVDLAVNRPVKAMILESTFSSAADVASVAYPFLPARFVMRTRLDSESKLPSIQIPLLFIHGSDDSIIPIRLGRKLFEAAREPKEFHLIQGADHNDVFLVGGEHYTALVRRFA